MENFMVILTILTAYLIGSVSSAVIISKIISGEDLNNVYIAGKVVETKTKW